MKTHTNLNDRLAEHFTLREMVASGTARRLNIENIPTERDVDCLRRLCQQVLEPLRRRFGVLRVTSGYRCEALNEAVGGQPCSQHLYGQAADLHCSSAESARRMYDYVRQHLDFDQVLLERRLSNGCCWLHVSYVSPRLNRRQASLLTL